MSFTLSLSLYLSFATEKKLTTANNKRRKNKPPPTHFLCRTPPNQRPSSRSRKACRRRRNASRKTPTNRITLCNNLWDRPTRQHTNPHTHKHQTPNNPHKNHTHTHTNTFRTRVATLNWIAPVQSASEMMKNDNSFFSRFNCEHRCEWIIRLVSHLMFSSLSDSHGQNLSTPNTILPFLCVSGRIAFFWLCWVCVSQVRPIYPDVSNSVSDPYGFPSLKSYAIDCISTIYISYDYYVYVWKRKPQTI